MRNLPKASEITGEKPAKSIMKQIGKSLLEPKKKKRKFSESSKKEEAGESKKQEKAEDFE